MISKLSLLVLIGCGHVTPAPLPEPSQTVRQKYHTYLDLARKETDSYGATYTEHCDSLLWSSLYHVSGGAVEIDAFRNGDKWYRRPSKDCYPRFSRSTISRDQLLGLLFYILKERRIDLAFGLIWYAEENGFVMGEGALSATHMTTNMMALLGRVTASLGGMNKYQWYPYMLPPGTESYHSHLQLLGILLHYKTEGYILENHKARIIEHHTRNRRNGFAAWMFVRFVGGPSMAIVRDILEDERLFPSNRLPTPQDRCTHYLWQRETYEAAHTGRGTMWEPCPRGKERYMGGDFLLVAALYLGIM